MPTPRRRPSGRAASSAAKIALKGGSTPAKPSPKPQQRARPTRGGSNQAEAEDDDEEEEDDDEEEE